MVLRSAENDNNFSSPSIHVQENDENEDSSTPLNKNQCSLSVKINDLPVIEGNIVQSSLLWNNADDEIKEDLLGTKFRYDGS